VLDCRKKSPDIAIDRAVELEGVSGNLECFTHHLTDLLDCLAQRRPRRWVRVLAPKQRRQTLTRLRPRLEGEIRQERQGFGAKGKA
jgi:hypothetical protein